MINAARIYQTQRCIWETTARRVRVADDVYFSTSGGIDETRHVFIEGVGGRKFFKNRRVTRIAELGFGTGLNFLATWQYWAEARQVAQHSIGIHRLRLSHVSRIAASELVDVP